jgi:hypothetical protein
MRATKPQDIKVERVLVRMHTKQAKEFKIACVKHDTNMSDVIRKLITEWMKTHN